MAEDAEVGPGIDNALGLKGVAWLSLDVGQIVLVKFSDGTTALYIKTNNSFTDHWAWGGIAHDKNGNLINPQGKLLTNPNTSGTGGGNGDTNSGGFNFLITGEPDCYASTRVTLPDGTVIAGGGWGPC